jgi:hypothetical protein
MMGVRRATDVQKYFNIELLFNKLITDPRSQIPKPGKIKNILHGNND